MTFLIILAGYVVGMLVTARVIGSEVHRENTQHPYAEDESYAWTAWAIVWPLLAVGFGWYWWVRGDERKEIRSARNEEKARKKEELLRDARNRERDDAMRPWNLTLRDPKASEEEKTFAQEVLRGLALK